MTGQIELTGSLFCDMWRGGAANLRAHASEINDLNVFPIPDGDTGENMLLTVDGGICAVERLPQAGRENLSAAADALAKGMLMGARGNSGVILSQLARGFADGVSGKKTADAEVCRQALQSAVSAAYRAVVTPTEGTVLTVAREAAAAATGDSVEEMLGNALAEAEASLARTPSLLACLAEAGVVDSGGAGLVALWRGADAVLRGEAPAEPVSAEAVTAVSEPDYDLFRAEDTLQFGYCTEFLLRLQTCKCDPETFDTEALTAYLSRVGNSVVCVKNGSIVKVHVHTFTPGEVLTYCQTWGEYLKLKIENMTVQHSEVQKERPTSGAAASQTDATPQAIPQAGKRKPFGIVAVADGAGISETFRSLGADVVVDGGQTRNPSAEELLGAIDRVAADTVFLFPNNGNILLAARQAAELYRGRADVRVVESRSVGDCYAALTMFDPTSGDADVVAAGFAEAMEGVVTGMVTHAVRDAHTDGLEIHCGDAVGMTGKRMLVTASDSVSACAALARAIATPETAVFLLLVGRDASAADADAAHRAIAEAFPQVELYRVDGGQAVYDFILIAE